MGTGMDMIKKSVIIQKMSENELWKNYYEKFCSLVDTEYKALETGALVREIGFTPHDFSHHCKDIYEILGIILPEEFYTVYNKGINLFILLVSVLFHDIINMASECTAESRRKHSEEGRIWFQTQMLDKNSFINKTIGDQFSEAIGDIIYAHSDVKDENNVTIKHTFLEIVNKYSDTSKNKTIDGEKINVPFLAAILRLADELDISYKRVSGTAYEQKHNTEDSKSHFEICEFFLEVQTPDDRPFELVLSVMDNKFNAVHNEYKPAVAAQLINRYLKIKQEFEMLYNEVLSDTRFAPKGIWKKTKIVLQDEEKYREYIKKKD